MVRGSAVRLVTVVSLLVFLSLMPARLAAAAASQGQPVTICHATGWGTTPWVLTTVDEATLPEHQAQGDFRANSLAECMQHAPPAQQPGSAPQGQAQLIGPQQQPGQSQQAAASQTAMTGTGDEAAGIQARDGGPDVSVLPQGGDPTRPTLVLVLVLLGGLGLSMRQPAGRRL